MIPLPLFPRHFSLSLFLSLFLSLSLTLSLSLSLSLSSVNYCNGSAVLRGMLKGQGLAEKKRERASKSWLAANSDTYIPKTCSLREDLVILVFFHGTQNKIFWKMPCYFLSMQLWQMSQRLFWISANFQMFFKTLFPPSLHVFMLVCTCFLSPPFDYWLLCWLLLLLGRFLSLFFNDHFKSRLHYD